MDQTRRVGCKVGPLVGSRQFAKNMRIHNTEKSDYGCVQVVKI